MASKRLGRFRQWAGEVISSNKSAVTEEARELEQDIDLRRDGVRKLQLATVQYHRNLSKKKLSEALDDPDKFLPRDALGIVMVTHGEELGDESLFGTSLVRLGRAHCKVATLQEAFALTLQDTYMISLERFSDQIKEYETERKKLETRRLNYDAALNKIEKINSNKKVKDKDRREAEEELTKAEVRYEESEEDVRARIATIQESEIDQMRELTAFFDNELKFAEQYVEILRDAKANWAGRSEISKMEIRRPSGPLHDFSRAAEVDVPVQTHRSRGSTVSLPRRIPSRPPSGSIDDSGPSGGESDDDEHRASSRKGSVRSRSGSARPPSRPPSRPASRTGRSRSDSTTTTGSAIEKEREKEKKKINVSGWASSWRGKKDKDVFASLKDDDDDDAGEIPRNASALSFSSNKAKARPSAKSSNSSPSIPSRSLKVPSRKLVRAVHDFAGSVDELSFSAGDEIVVLNEVLDEWWMGELGGRKGLFPTSYTEIITTSSASSISSRPRMPSRVKSFAGSTTDSEDSSIRHPPVDDKYGFHTAADDREHPFGDHNMPTVLSPSSGHFGYDTESINESAADDSENELERRLMPKSDDEDIVVRQTSRAPPPVLPLRRPTDTGTVRKAPPPPPLRRVTVSNNASPQAIAMSLSEQPSRVNLKSSPFVSSVSLPDSETGPCQNFQQNVFKANGMCANCFRMHIV